MSGIYAGVILNNCEIDAVKAAIPSLESKHYVNIDIGGNGGSLTAGEFPSEDAEYCFMEDLKKVINGEDINHKRGDS